MPRSPATREQKIQQRWVKKVG